MESTPGTDPHRGLVEACLLRKRMPQFPPVGTPTAAPVGIVLCSDKDGAEVEFATAGMDQKLFVSRYLTALPPVAKLRAFLEADRERIESLMPAARGTAKLVKRTPVSQSTRRKA